MNVAQMRMMLTLAESGSMTMTAKKLRVTQPALTYQLKTIESELGFKVFNRTRVGTSLTAEGAFLIETIRSIVDDYDEAVRLSRAMASGSAAGTIRVGTNSFSRDTISFSLNVAQYSVTFSLIPCGTSDPIDLLREGVIDFWSTSAGSLIGMPSTLRFAKLTEVSQSVFLPLDHPLASKDSITIEDLKNEIVWLWPRGRASSAANEIRNQLEAQKTDVADLIPGVPAVVTAFASFGVVIYDDGYLPPPAYAAKRVRLENAPVDMLGLAYLTSQEERLAPIIADLREHIPNNRDRIASKSELVAERIVTVLDDISNTVRRGGMKDIVPLVEYGLELGISAYHILNRGLMAGMNAAGQMFESGDMYTTEMMAAVSTTNLAMDVLQPHLALEDAKPVEGTAVIGTVKGDKHDIGKNLVRIMLESRDIEVVDLGRQVPASAFVEHVRDNPNCNLVLVSVNRVELLDNARGVVEALEEAGLRDRVFVMVGGAATSQQFADEIGADAYTASAEDAAEKARELLRL